MIEPRPGGSGPTGARATEAPESERDEPDLEAATITRDAGDGRHAWIVGGVVLALRLLIGGFGLSSVAAIVGQLPRELVVTTALLDVGLPAAVGGLLAIGALESIREVAEARRKRTGKPPKLLSDHPNNPREVAWSGLVSLILVGIGARQILADGFSVAALLALILSWGFTLLFTCASWREIKRYAYE